MTMKQTKEQFVGITYDELLAENAKLREQVANLTDRSIRMADKMDCLYAENEHMRLKDMAVMGELGEENERLKAENAKLRELLVGAYKDMDAWQMVIAGSNEWGYGKGCLDSLYKLRDAMQELGIEVDG